MIAHLAGEEPPVSAERVLEICALTPRQRFEALLGVGGAESDECIAALLQRNDGFLEQVQRPREELLADFGQEEPRRQRLAEAGDFGERIFELLSRLVRAERFRHLLV
jgi:hypothetical protein